MGASEQGVSVFYSEVRPSPTVVRGEKDIEHDNVFYRARIGESRIGSREARGERVFKFAGVPIQMPTYPAEDFLKEIVVIRGRESVKVERNRDVTGGDVHVGIEQGIADDFPLAHFCGALGEAMDSARVFLADFLPLDHCNSPGE